MKEFKGVIEFITLWEPIKFITKDEIIDFREIIFSIIENLNDKKCKIKLLKNSIEIFNDEKSRSILKFIDDDVDERIEITLINKTNITNVNELITRILLKLNNKLITLTITDKSIKITK